MSPLSLQTNCAGDVDSMAPYALPDDSIPFFGRAPADEQIVTYRDMRGLADQPQLRREGFELIHHESKLSDFEDGEEVSKTYLNEIGDLIQRSLGAHTVFMQQNWVLRAESREFGMKELPRGQNVMSMKTGGFIHIDYDDQAAEDWARYTFEKAGVTERPNGRLMVVTAWRAISAPPQDLPLGFIDRRTVNTTSYVKERIQSPLFNWHGYQITYDPNHRFCWWSNMRSDEVVLFLQHEGGYGPGSACPHTAFVHPGCRGSVPTRASIEVRGYAFVGE